MKIGILTFHRADNYGALLQAYALVKKLRNLGENAQIIDYRSDAIERQYYPYKYIPHIRKNIIKWCWNVFQNLTVIPKLNEKGCKCIAFRDKYFHMTESVKTEADRKNIENTFDLILTGSDQIWNPSIVGGKDDWYCYKRSGGRAKIVAFAASAGSLKEFQNKFSEFQTDLNAYDAISVREDDIREFLSKNVSCPVVKLMDPVFLLDRQDWDQIAVSPLNNKKYLFYYDVERNPVSNALARKIAKEKKLLLVHFDDKHIYEKGYMVNVGPEEFVGLIRDAEYVVTSSFHATAFSIIFKKKFISAIHPTTGARVLSVLTELGLEDRIVTSVEEFHGFNDNFDGVDERLAQQRNEQLDFLKEVFDLCQTKTN